LTSSRGSGIIGEEEAIQMDLDEKWEKALKNTEILRSRVSHLLSVEETCLPYIFLAESRVNIGDTVVRKGDVLVHKPLIFLPRYHPQFEGFDFKKDFGIDDDAMTTFLLMRGVQFPSLKYDHKLHSLDVYEGPLKKAVKEYKDQLEKKEDIHTGLIVGIEDLWQFSILVYVGALVIRSAPQDVKRFLDDLKKKMEGKE
jgi:hypothetical protein